LAVGLLSLEVLSIAAVAIWAKLPHGPRHRRLRLRLRDPGHPHLGCPLRGL